VLLNKAADRTISHSPLKLVLMRSLYHLISQLTGAFNRY